MDNVKSLKNLGEKVNGVRPSGHTICEVLDGICDSYNVAFEVVDELPQSDIKPNVIYAVKETNYNGYTYAYGTRVPTLTDDNFAESVGILSQALVKNGFPESELERLLVLSQFGYLPSRCDNGEASINNYYDSNTHLYTLDVNGIYYKTFNTVNELSNYLLGGDYLTDITNHNEGQGVSEALTLLNQYGFKYSTEALSDDEFGVAYLAEETYKYYIYDGKELVALSDDVVVKKLVNADNGKFIDLLKTITFTNEEYERLYNGAELLIQLSSNQNNIIMNTFCLSRSKAKTSMTVEGTEYRYVEFDYYITVIDIEEHYVLSISNNSQNIEAVVTQVANAYIGNISIETIKWNQIQQDTIDTIDKAYYDNGYLYSAQVQGIVGSGNSMYPTVILSPDFNSEYSIKAMISGKVSIYGAVLEGVMKVYAKELPTEVIKLKYACME